MVVPRATRDPAAINAGVDLLALIGAGVRLRRTGGTRGGEWHGPCPWCQGTDRFFVQPREGRWYCRQCEPRGGDAIRFVMLRDHLTFPDACDVLTGTPSTTEARPMQQPPEKTVAPPGLAWQDKARALASRAQETLWGPQGARALSYLREKRLLTDATICAAGLGYVPRDGETLDGCHILYRGITIPWWDGAELWQVKIRRPPADLGEKDDKYSAIQGGHPYLYAPAGLPAEGPLVFTEGEFDALVLWQALTAHGAPVAGVVSLGAAGAAGKDGRGLPEELRRRLLAYDPLLAAYDRDGPGEQGLAGLRLALPRLRTLGFPREVAGKDVTDLARSGHNLRAWVETAILSLTAQAEHGDATLTGAVQRETATPARSSVARHPAHVAGCDLPNCDGPLRDPPDPETGTWCIDHRERASLLDFALLLDWPSFWPIGRPPVAGAVSWRAFVRDADDLRLAVARAFLAEQAA